MNTKIARKVDKFVREHMEAQHIPGLSLAVVEGGEVVISRGYGQASVELDVPATPDTVYQIGSITKQFTATAVMMLAVEGKISLDAPIVHFVDGVPESWYGVNIRHLLTHTSGIMSYTDLPDLMHRSLADVTREEILSLVADTPLAFTPGERNAYCNTGYFLLGHAIERAASRRYGDFLRERIFEPLGMSSTRVNNMHEIIPNRAAGYTWADDRLTNATHISMTWPFSAGALVSTVADLSKWTLALGDKSLLPSDAWNRMWTQTILNDGSSADYGFGWGVHDYQGHKVIGHGGGIPGFITFSERYVDDDLAVIVLTNLAPSDPAAIARGVAGHFVAELTPAPASPPA